MKKVGIVGYGYVGKAYHEFFKNHFEVRVYDTAIDNLNTKEEINDCDLAVICVPTPMGEDGKADLTAIHDVFSWLVAPLIIIKSAVPPGTTENLPANVCVSPEFIGEGKYFIPFWKYPHPTDSRMHEFFIIGGNEPYVTEITEYFLKVMGPSTRIIKMSHVEAEIVKYMENSWGATKVTFANEFYEICNAFGADYQTVREGFCADGRVERMHTMVLSDKRGFGGKCFPKDVTALYHASKEQGYEPKLLKQVLASNETWQK